MSSFLSKDVNPIDHKMKVSRMYQVVRNWKYQLFRSQESKYQDTWSCGLRDTKLLPELLKVAKGEEEEESEGEEEEESESGEKNVRNEEG